MKGINIGLQVVRAIVAVAGVILCLMLVTNWSDTMESFVDRNNAQNFLEAADKCNPETISDDTLRMECEERKSYAGVLNGSVNLIWIALGICAIGAVAFGVLALVRNPKRNLRAVIGIVLLVVVSIIGYAMASGMVSTNWNSDVVQDLGMLDAMNAGEEHQTSKLSGAGLKTFYILLGLTVASVAYLEISKIFK